MRARDLDDRQAVAVAHGFGIHDFDPRDRSRINALIEAWPFPPKGHRMFSFKLPHWVIAILTLIAAEGPKVADAFPGNAKVASVVSVVVQIAALLAGIVGVVSGSAMGKKAGQVVAGGAGKSLMTLMVLALPMLLCGCPKAFGAVSPALDCGARVTADAAKGMGLPQILADLPSQCGLDLAQVIAILAASKDPHVQHSKAYTEALKARAELLSMPDPAVQ